MEAIESRQAIVERLRELISEQNPLLQRLLPEARRWEDMGLDLVTGICLAFTDAPDVWERIRHLGDEMLAQLQELERIDRSGPGPEGHMASRVRWALGRNWDRP